MQRREFIAALAGAVAAASALRPHAVSAQQAEKVRHIGVLMGLSESNPEYRDLFAAFLEELARLVGSTAAPRGSSSGGQRGTSSARVLSRRNW